MRIRNNKVNVFLSDDEKFILKRDSAKLNLSHIVKALEENINCLINVKNKFHHIGYFEDERAIGTKIECLKLQNTTLKNILAENDKDNVN